MSTTAGPSSNWAKLQQKIVPTSSSASSRKGKEPMRGHTASAKSKSRSSGIAAFARHVQDPAEPGPSTLTVDVPAPSIKEGVVFKASANLTSIQVESREMVAGRTPMTDARRAPGNYVAIDCEMVGLGHMGAESALARVSLVNYHGHISLDTFVAPRERVTDWRTWVSGVREEDLMGAPTFQEVQKMVAGIVEGRILVGHAIENDLKVLSLNHPGPMVRDTQKCKALRERAKNKRPGLKKSVEMELGLEIQKGAHSSVTDARATMALYRSHRVDWEKQLRPATEAYKIKTGKRKRDAPASAAHQEGEEGDGTDGLQGGKKHKQEFPGGGKRGISSGLGRIVKKNGVRIDQRTGKVLEGKSRPHVPDVAAGGGSGGSWWEEDP